jgi:UDP-N-acetylmuramoylalanine--D-glutamate ligase
MSAMTPARRPIATPADLADLRVLVLGLARSGVAAARMLSDSGAVVTTYDRRSADELADEVAALGERRIALALGATPDRLRALLDASDLVVTSPSVSPDFSTTEPWLREALGAAREAGIELVSEVELFLRLTRARVMAVTGTKGKTTTTALIGAILAQAGVPHVVGGNIGTPLVEQVVELGPEDWAVLELSELQLPTISRGVEIAVYTNIGADHLDRHATEQAYRAVKARLAELSVAHGRVVLNADDPGCRELGARLPAAALAWYGLEDGRGHLAGRLAGAELVVLDSPVLPVADVPLPGRHQLADVLAASLACALSGVDRPDIAAAIRAFGGVPHRLETVAEADGVRWVNDSQATIPMAALAALDTYPAGQVVLVAGGKDKGLDYAELADRIVERCRGLVLIGETGDELASLVGDRVTVRRAGSMRDAVEAAADLARPGDVVLLSPAAASFDMFVDYAARGDAFRLAAQAIAGGGGAAE